MCNKRYCYPKTKNGLASYSGKQSSRLWKTILPYILIDINIFFRRTSLYSLGEKKRLSNYKIIKNLQTRIPFFKSSLTERRKPGHVQATRSKSEKSSSSFTSVFPSLLASEACTRDLRIRLMPEFAFVLCFCTMARLGRGIFSQPPSPPLARPTSSNPRSSRQWWRDMRRRQRTWGSTWRGCLSQKSSTCCHCPLIILRWTTNPVSDLPVNCS